MKKISDLNIEYQIKHYKDLVAILPMNKGIPILKKIIELEKIKKDKDEKSSRCN